MRRIIVWHNLNNDSYYYRIVSGNYAKYEIGFRNQYNHEVILIVDSGYFEKNKTSFKKKVIMRLISFLQKIDK